MHTLKGVEKKEEWLETSGPKEGLSDEFPGLSFRSMCPRQNIGESNNPENYCIV